VCGIVLVVGPGADQGLFGRMLASIRPRGDVEETLLAEGLLAGTQRLRIVDRERAVQPWASADDRFLLCYNGEVYHHRALRAELAGRGHRMRTDGDTEVVLEAFLEWGEQAVHRLRGEYAFAIVERATGRTYLARDPLGVKPLYWSRAGDRLHVGSEVKALVPVGTPVSEVPPGHHGWAEPGEEPKLVPHLDLLRLGADADPLEDPAEAVGLVRETLSDSIRVRLDTDLPVAVILSGGLDSTLTLLHVRQMHPDCVAFTVGSPHSEDLRYARRLTRELGVEHEVIELRPRDVGLAEIREAIRMSELTEYGDIINAVISVPLFRRIADRGIKVVLGGDGSDELFGGYPMYERIGPERSRRLFLHKIRNLGRTELQRVDRTSMGQGVEVRVPFLDPALVELAMRVPAELKIRDGQEKWIVREAFADMLPDYVRRRPKNGLSYSTGLHDRARLYKPLFPRLYRSFGYELAAPIRRDFDTTLARLGHDLDRVEAEAAAPGDYTLPERARDLAGAVRWNIQPPLARLVSRRWVGSDTG
jgi:asparagine synthase (glutamine-hydrolysing)